MVNLHILKPEVPVVVSLYCEFLTGVGVRQRSNCVLYTFVLFGGIDGSSYEAPGQAYVIYARLGSELGM